MGPSLNPLHFARNTIPFPTLRLTKLDNHPGGDAK